MERNMVFSKSSFGESTLKPRVHTYFETNLVFKACGCSCDQVASGSRQFRQTEVPVPGMPSGRSSNLSEPQRGQTKRSIGSVGPRSMRTVIAHPHISGHPIA